MKLLKIKLKPNEVAVICLIILCLFVVFNMFWKNSPMNTGLKNVQSRIEASKKKLAEDQALFDKLSKISSPTDSANSADLDQYVLLNDRFSSVISGIVRNSKTKSFALTKLVMEDESLESGYKKVLYSLDAEASFIEIGKFLEKLEDASLLTEVSSVEINRIDEEMKRCLAHIRLYSYVRAE
jgi:hypothetical protein